MGKYPKLRYKGFEGCWKEYKLIDITSLYQPVTISKEQMTPNGKYKVFGANGYIGYYDQYNHSKETLAISCRGENCGTINLIEPQSWITGNSMVVVPDEEALTKYLYYTLSKKNIKKYVTGGAQPQLTRENLKPLMVKIPTSLEVSKIESLLSKIDILINEKEKETNNINILRNYHLKEKFHSIIGNSKMQDIMILKNGRDYKHCSKGNVPVYGTGGFMTKIDQSLSTIDAIGIGRKGTIDNPFILRAPFWTVDTLFYAIPKNVPLYYLYLQFQSINWKQYNEGSTLPSLTSKSINNVKIHLHTQNEISHISNLFENFDKLLLISNNELKYYYEIKKFLLTKMLV